jgi:hypothetical protein
MRTSNTLPAAVSLALMFAACSGDTPVRPDALQPALSRTLAAPTTAASSASGPVVLDVPSQSPGAPVYAYIAGFFMNTDGNWVAIEIVRARRCIPEGFNLLRFADNPAAFGCTSLIGGREWWYPEDLDVLPNGPWSRIPPFPFEARLTGLSGMLIYFVKLTELDAAISDGILTIVELERLPSLLVGLVDSYLQVQHNSNQGQAPGHSDTIARGTLRDGRSFFYQRTDRDNEALSVNIRFQ